MTYQVKISIHADGTAACEPSPGTPPGEFTIAGHDDGNLVTISVAQRDTRGRFVIRATHHRDRAEETLEHAEAEGAGGAAAAAAREAR
ncbi:MAG TPA: hypothetical protein VKV80_16300 [Streptosporangiaceae bacterium]|nr:hypothetical protein [Streptosporangiaceae bacterium]